LLALVSVAAPNSTPYVTSSIPSHGPTTAPPLSHARLVPVACSHPLPHSPPGSLSAILPLYPPTFLSLRMHGHSRSLRTLLSHSKDGLAVRAYACQRTNMNADARTRARACTHTGTGASPTLRSRRPSSRSPAAPSAPDRSLKPPLSFTTTPSPLPPRPFSSIVINTQCERQAGPRLSRILPTRHAPVPVPTLADPSPYTPGPRACRLVCLVLP
jgi:hypothetical protein